ncbi:MAG: amidohydrolase family protein [Dehalococcoidia bacterium]
MTSSGKGELIDWHTHCWTREIITDAAREEMKKHGVRGTDAWPENFQKAVADTAQKFMVIAGPTRPGRKQSNDFVSEYVSQFPGRAVGLCSVHPEDEGAVEEVHRSMTELGLKGLKLSPVYQGFDPWDPKAWALYEKVNELNGVVMYHMGGGYPPSATLEWGNPLTLDRIGRTYPDLRIIVAHFGQPMMEETVVLMRKNQNIWTDLSARFHRKWQLYNGLQVAIEYKVHDRILFGSDFPVMTTQEALDAFVNINDWGEGVKMPRIPEEIINDIIYNRPFDLLGF